MKFKPGDIVIDPKHPKLGTWKIGYEFTVTPGEFWCVLYDVYDNSISNYPADFVDKYCTLKNTHSDCAHSWVKYSGLTNEFDFCTKCDIKK